MRLVVSIFVLLVVFGCKKPENRACWKFAGDENTTKIIPLETFDLVFLGAHLEYVLVQDTVNFVQIEGYENLVNLVETNISEGKLRIENKNKCNFLRNYKTKKIKVTLHFKDIINLEYQGTETLTNLGQLNLPYFTMTVVDGAGPVNLNVKSDVLVGIIKHGYGDFTFSGEAKYANFVIASNGFCNTNSLIIADSIDVVSRTPVVCRYNFSNAKAKVEFQSSGNIEYIGNPSSIETNYYGTGQLIDAN